MPTGSEPAKSYRPTKSELKAIDEAEAAVIARQDEVEAAFAAFRRQVDTEPQADQYL